MQQGSVVDVSSGHWPSGWQRGVKWSGQDYTGLDITPKMIEDNRAFFKESAFLLHHKALAIKY